MKTNIFTKEFYKHLFTKMEADFGNVEYNDMNEYICAYEVDGYDIELTVSYDFEWHDDSFDHAFGTWHDPYPYWEACGIIEVFDVVVFETGTENEVTGFDCDEFISTVYPPKSVKVS